MRNLIFVFVLFISSAVSCVRPICCEPHPEGIKIEYKTKDGKHLLEMLPMTASNFDLYYHIDGKLELHNEAMSVIEFNSRKIVSLWPNEHTINNRSTSLILINGYESDTIVSEFSSTGNALELKSYTINGVNFPISEIIIRTK